MHYYSFNIGDYASSTAHLEPLEDLAYRRLLDLYYSSESAIPEDLNQTARLIRMRTHSECIASVLSEFFALENDGWHCERADVEIFKYNEKSHKASKSAKARWKKAKAKQKVKPPCESNANALETHSDGNAKQEPLTTNHEPPIKDLMSDNSDAVFVLEYLNGVVGTKYKPTTKSHIQNVNGRLEEGHSVDDLKLVVDFKFKEWGGDQKMSGYLRPQTLFQTGKFQGYLTAARTTPSGKHRNINDIGTDFSAPAGFNTTSTSKWDGVTNDTKQ